MNTVTLDGKPLTPSKIFCVGRNYGGHIKEMGSEKTQEPVIFIKPNSAISHEVCIDPNDPLDYEAELCLLMKNQKIAAVGFGLDLTKRSLQRRLKNQGLPWELSKAFDGSALLSEFVTVDHVSPEMTLELLIDDCQAQCGAVKSMIFSPTEIIHYIEQFFTINDGDIIMTGTPEGVGPLSPGKVLVGALHLKDRCITRARWTVAAKG